MKIIDVNAIPFSIPYGEKLSWATGESEAADHILVTIETDDGIKGYAESIPRPTIYGESQESVVTAINNWFKPLLLNVNPFSINEIENNLSNFPANNTAKGAINLALLDIQAKYVKLPLYKYLGGNNQPIKLTWMVNLNTPEIMLNQVINKYEEGIKSFKIKGGIEPKDDINLIKSIRQKIGYEIFIYIDANQGYSSEMTSYVIESLKEYDVSIIEEPIDIKTYSTKRMKKRVIASNSKAQILGDESVFTPYDVLNQLSENNIDLISIKPARTGLTDSRKIMTLANLYGVKAILGTQGETAIGTLSAAHVALGLNITDYPAELSFFTLFNHSLVVEKPVVINGELILSDRPGTGIEIDESALEYYRQDL